MTERPLLVDLYSGAGGATKGYHDAGFDVVGVDIKRQPRYPFRHEQMDAITFLRNSVVTMNAYGHGHVAGRRVTAIHASPPCQFGTALRHAPGAREHVNLIPETRELLEKIGLPYVIENVDSDKVRPFMPGATCLCGSMFELGVMDHGVWHQLQRHRLFTTGGGFRLKFATMEIKPDGCISIDHPDQDPLRHAHTSPVIGVYGGHARRRAASAGGRSTRDAWELGHKGAASAALGIDWMTLDELSQAIPPAYTYFIGLQLLEEVRRRGQ